MVQWLRNSKSAQWVLLALRLYVGWALLKAGWDKVTATQAFDAAGFLQGAVKASQGQFPVVQGWYADFVSGFAIPNVGLFNFLVPWGELLVGIGLITGTFTTFSVIMAMTMNFNYLLAGAGNTNTNLVFCAMFIAFAGFNAGRLGLDAYLIPWLRSRMGKGNASRSASA